jgi:hypothetical protein
LTGKLKQNKEQYTKESMRDRKSFKNDEEYREARDSARIDADIADRRMQETKNKMLQCRENLLSRKEIDLLDVALIARNESV